MGFIVNPITGQLQKLTDFHVVTSLPASPTDGQAVRLDLTGRSVIMTYDGSAWMPLHSVGAMTMYVDDGSGTDSAEKGTASGASAFATIQYAIDTIPGSVGGNVVINLSGDTYTENLIIRGKFYTGDYTITINGTLTEDLSATLDSAVEGTGATHGSITDTGAFGSFDNQLIYSTSLDEYRVIDSDTANVATITGKWGGVPSGNYKVYDWATTIDGTASNAIYIAAAQTGIIINNIKVTTASSSASSSSFHNAFSSQTIVNRCSINNTTIHGFGAVVDSADATFDTCIVGPFASGGGPSCIHSINDGQATASRTKIYCSVGNTAMGFRSTNKSTITMNKGCIIDNCDNSNGASRIDRNSIALYLSVGVHNIIRNSVLGIKSSQGAQGYFATASYVTFTNCDTDTTADAATFGYLQV